MAACFHIYSVFLSAVTCGLSPLSCVTEWFHLCRAAIYFFSGPINRNKTTADFRFGFMDGLIWRIKNPSRMQISG